MRKLCIIISLLALLIVILPTVKAKSFDDDTIARMYRAPKPPLFTEIQNHRSIVNKVEIKSHRTKLDLNVRAKHLQPKLAYCFELIDHKSNSLAKKCR